MKVILREKVPNLGNVGDQVNVKAGYGRNFLIPYGKALLATERHIAEFEKNRAELEKKAQDVLEQAQTRAKDLADKTITIMVRASEEGKLFGSVGARDIAKAINASMPSMTIEKREISLPEGSIHAVGEYPVKLNLHRDVAVTLKIKVCME